MTNGKWAIESAAKPWTFEVWKTTQTDDSFKQIASR